MGTAQEELLLQEARPGSLVEWGEGACPTAGLDMERRSGNPKLVQRWTEPDDKHLGVGRGETEKRRTWSVMAVERSTKVGRSVL